MQINPGTEPLIGATVENATAVLYKMIAGFEFAPGVAAKRVPEADRDGWFRFILSHAGRTVEVDVPGDDPGTTMRGIPFASRRLYVNGNSWLYGFAIGIVQRRLTGDEE